MISIVVFDPETVDHILRDYLWSSRLWLLCPLGLVVDSFAGYDFASWISSQIVHKSQEAIELAFMLAWSI